MTGLIVALMIAVLVPLAAATLIVTGHLRWLLDRRRRAGASRWWA